MAARPRTEPTVNPEAELLAEIAAAWPPELPDDGRGYRRVPVGSLEPRAALDLDGSGRFVVVVVAHDADLAALPLTRTGAGWRMAVAGDGMAAVTVRRLAGVAGVRHRTGAFQLRRDAAFDVAIGSERGLVADQSNHSVVVDGSVLLKWRTAFDADGQRAALLRRHLHAVGYELVPALLGTIDWEDGAGGRITLADLDAYLPDATDGWDLCIAALQAWIGVGPPAVLAAADLPRRLGRMTASLHGALAHPSARIPSPCQHAVDGDVAAWASKAREVITAAAGIEAPDQADVVARTGRLLADIDLLAAIGRTPIQPIHGDLHIGQLVAWRDGLAFIDLDGPPGERSAGLKLEPAARDVAQMLVALDNLAAAVDARTEGQHAGRLRRWAVRAERQFLAAYRDQLEASRLPDLLDERLIRPFIAEQLGRELVYAEATLPRWRYAPMTALRWRFPEEST